MACTQNPYANVTTFLLATLVVLTMTTSVI